MKKIPLIKPLGYFKEGCNGCGTGWSEKLVPDTIYGMSIEEACCVHDYMYVVGATEEDKVNADHVFLDNMLILIANNHKWYYPTMLARHRAITYFDAVTRAGGKTFWEGKTND